MTLFILQITLITTVAVVAGMFIGWWAHLYYVKEPMKGLKKEFQLVKNYFTESLKENAKLKLQLKLSEEKLDILSSKKVVDGVDFEAYQIFENTVKEAQRRRFLN